MTGEAAGTADATDAADEAALRLVTLAEARPATEGGEARRTTRRRRRRSGGRGRRHERVEPRGTREAAAAGRAAASAVLLPLPLPSSYCAQSPNTYSLPWPAAPSSCPSPSPPPPSFGAPPPSGAPCLSVAAGGAAATAAGSSGAAAAPPAAQPPPADSDTARWRERRIAATHASRSASVGAANSRARLAAIGAIQVVYGARAPRVVVVRVVVRVIVLLLVAAVATVRTGWQHRRGRDGGTVLAGIAPAQRRHRRVVGALCRLGVVAVDVDVVVLVVVMWRAACRRSAAAWRSRCVIVAADGDSAAAAHVAAFSSAGRQGFPRTGSPETSTSMTTPSITTGTPPPGDAGACVRCGPGLLGPPPRRPPSAPLSSSSSSPRSSSSTFSPSSSVSPTLALSAAACCSSLSQRSAYASSPSSARSDVRLWRIRSSGVGATAQSCSVGIARTPRSLPSRVLTTMSNGRTHDVEAHRNWPAALAAAVVRRAQACRPPGSRWR